MRIWIGSAIAAATLVAAAASVSAKNQESRGTGKVRLIHNFQTDAVPQPASIDIRFGKNADPASNPLKVKGAHYGTISKYLRLKSPPLYASVFVAGTGTQLFSTNLGPIRKQRLTLLATQSSASGAFLIQLLDDSDRKPKRKEANVRVIHGIPSAAADNVKVGAVGVGCLTSAVSFGANAVLMVPAGTYTLGVFPPSDPDCTGEPLPGLKTEQELNSRSAYTAIAQVKQGDPNAFQLQVVRDF